MNLVHLPPNQLAPAHQLYGRGILVKLGRSSSGSRFVRGIFRAKTRVGVMHVARLFERGRGRKYVYGCTCGRMYTSWGPTLTPYRHISRNRKPRDDRHFRRESGDAALGCELYPPNFTRTPRHIVLSSVYLLGLGGNGADKQL